MKLSEIIAIIHSKEMQIVLEAEINDKEFLNAKGYLTSYARAKAGMDIVIIQETKVLALLDANHQMKEHGIDKTFEMESLMEELKPEYVNLITDEKGMLLDFWVLD